MVAKTCFVTIMQVNMNEQYYDVRIIITVHDAQAWEAHVTLITQ